MKKICFLLWCILSVSGVIAQDNTYNLTVYKEYKPAVLHMVSGRTVNNPLTNVFLKNGALLYKQGDDVMELNMATITAADFGDDHYIKIEDRLALFIDSVGRNQLYSVSLVDLDSYRAMLRNNVNITHLDFGGDQLQYTTIDLELQEGQTLPVINIFYYYYNGRIVRVHERDLYRILTKDKKRMYKTVISMDGFKWTDPDSLMQLLKAISD